MLVSLEKDKAKEWQKVLWNLTHQDTADSVSDSERIQVLNEIESWLRAKIQFEESHYDEEEAIEHFEEYKKARE